MDKVLDSLNFDLRQKCDIIVGKSGAGKTTLIILWFGYCVGNKFDNIELDRFFGEDSLIWWGILQDVLLL